MRRVILNGQSYAMGLKWFHFRGTREEAIQEAHGRDAQFDLIVVLTDHEQYGLGRSEGSSWKKTKSLAASLVRNNCPDAVHVFSFHDESTKEPFWWVIGILKKRISAQSDRCFGNKEEAEALAISIQNSLGVEHKFFSEEESLAFFSNHLGAPKKKLFLRDATALSSLRETDRIKLLKAGLWVMAFALGWWTVDAVLEYKAARDAMEQARILTQNKERRAKELAAHPERYFSSVWMKSPEPDSFLRQCAPAMFRFPTAANGWRLAGLSCSGDFLNATWEHTEFSDFMYLPFNGALDHKKPQIATSSKILPVLPEGQREPGILLSQDEATRRIYALTQHFRLKLKKLSFTKRETRTVEKIQLTCPWIRGSWEINKIPAVMITDYANVGPAFAIPGLIITELSYDKDTWTIRGELYAR
ncbi:type 4b pilus protein PilO2 [Bilophila wadsworthia]|uniref:type 4b pilus protein PilO2 n=1 Tax=Bilophila wadsworthia TaxID=35833 RepID=UPI001D0B169A|nr:type 4b pilus protein PilO2 [Bilophila wadsworthia]MCB8572392.1 type 4b pilus protein PilO2 [Bilophila wadsworthia]